MTEQIDPLFQSQAAAATDLINLLSQKVVGQSSATKAIVPYVYMYQSGLAPEGRPAGVILPATDFKPVSHSGGKQ